MVKELELLLKKHFEQVGIICCDETCFCWDVQSFLTSLEEKANQHNAHLTPETQPQSQAVVNASASEPSDGDTRPAQVQVA